MQYDLAVETGPIEKQREFLWRLADAFDKDGRLLEAEEQLQELLDMPLSDEQRLEALCFLAEIQVRFVWGFFFPPLTGPRKGEPKLGWTNAGYNMLLGLARAEERLQELLAMPLSHDQRLEALCFLARDPSISCCVLSCGAQERGESKLGAVCF